MTRPTPLDPTLVPRLSAYLSDHHIHFDLLVPQADLQGSPPRGVDQPINRSEWDQLLNGVERLMRHPDGTSFWSEAQVIGGLLYRTLIPKPLRAPLQE